MTQHDCADYMSAGVYNRYLNAGHHLSMIVPPFAIYNQVVISGNTFVEAVSPGKLALIPKLTV